MPEKRGKSFEIWLIIFAVATAVLWQFEIGRLVLYPFTLLGTWFHEMAHGLAAIIFGATFLKLEIYPNGSGVAQYAISSDGLYFGRLGRAMIAAAGPLGPTVAGSIFIAVSKNKTWTAICVFLLAAALIASAIIWTRPLWATAFILAFGLVVLFVSFKGGETTKRVILQFLGVQALLSLYLSVDYLFSSGGGQFKSDTAVIQEYLFLPYWFWGGAILAVSVLLIYASARSLYKR